VPLIIIGNIVRSNPTSIRYSNPTIIKCKYIINLNYFEQLHQKN